MNVAFLLKCILHLMVQVGYTQDAIFKTHIKFFLYKFSFLHYLNNLRVPIGIKPAPGDHESDDENSFLLLTNLILLVCVN